MIHTDIPPPHTTNRAINIDVAFDIAYEKEVKRWRSIYINKTKKHSCITNFLCCCCKSKKYPNKAIVHSQRVEYPIEKKCMVHQKKIQIYKKTFFKK